MTHPTLAKRRARVAGGELAYFESGEGKPVVFLHGFPTSSHLWRDLAPIVSTQARAIAPDLLGYGDSDKPSRDPLHPRAQAGYVRELLQHLGVETFAVVGHDIGGAVAQLLALEGGVEAMVLIDSVAFDSWPIEGVKLLQQTEPERYTKGFVDSVVRVSFEQGMRYRERLEQRDLEEYLRPWREEPEAMHRAVRAIDGEGLEGIEDALGKLDLASFVLWGEDDPYQPSALAERLGDALPGSTVALLPGCSHFLLDDARETAVPLVFEWLRAVYLGKPRHAPGTIAPEELGISFDRPEGGP